MEIVERDLGMPCLALTLRTDSPAEPPASQQQARRGAAIAHARPPVRKAVITAAGLGTRLFPATRATKKELFPVVDRDGVAKPAILLIVEEAVEAGLEEVIIVVQRQGLESFQSLFAGSSPDRGYDKLPAHLQRYVYYLEELGRRVSFAVQPTQEGFGHAVYRAREAVGDEPFLLMLGDHLHRTSNTRSCTQQLLEIYDRHGISVLGLRRTPERAVDKYGTVTGQWLEENRLLRATELAEKPSVEYARAHLRVPGLPEGEYLTLFGLYLLTPQVFELLQEQIAGNERERGEFQLSTALERPRREDGILGLVVDGQSYDIGLPDSYLHALQHLRHGAG
jgi:UTP--glucose-1-phosphate uridylyltransferase